MPRFVVIVLIAVLLMATMAPSLFASPVQLASQQTNQFMTSPLSPLPHPGDSNDNDNNNDSDPSDPFHRSGSNASTLVWAPQPQLNQLWIKTHQIGVGWWDAAGHLHIALSVNGLVKIPLPDAVMISIPRNAAGLLAPPGWQKMMRPENGEWVIVRIP